MFATANSNKKLRSGFALGILSLIQYTYTQQKTLTNQLSYLQSKLSFALVQQVDEFLQEGVSGAQIRLSFRHPGTASIIRTGAGL